MRIGAPREIIASEARVAMTPESAKALQKLGFDCVIETGAGQAARFSDSDYESAGVTIVSSADELFKTSDIVLKVRAPADEEIGHLRKDQTLICIAAPGQNEELLKKVSKTGANLLAMDMVPRISRAQKMDVLSSMANIAGYRAVIESGNQF